MLLLSPQAGTELPLTVLLQGSWSASELIYSKFFYFHGSVLSAKGREGIALFFLKKNEACPSTGAQAKKYD